MPLIPNAYRQRLRRQRLRWRAFQSRRDLTAARVDVPDRPDAILAFATVRNEAERLPYFLAHHRALSVEHFLFVDNGSDDSTVDLLLDAPDVSLWETSASYRGSRFGMDWMNHLLMRHGHGRWCLVLDADELLVIPHAGSRGLPDLCNHLDDIGQEAFGALMLEVFPKGPVDQIVYRPGQDPLEVMPWFDATGYRTTRQPGLEHLWVQGGPRDRMFWKAEPARAPTLNKLPLIKWDRRYAFVNSTHSALPPRLNRSYGGPGSDGPSGVLVHTKFLPSIVAKSAEELGRQQHFGDPTVFADYHRALTGAPDFWHPEAHHFEGWEQLERLKLMSRGDWT